MQKELMKKTGKKKEMEKKMKNGPECLWHDGEHEPEEEPEE